MIAVGVEPGDVSEKGNKLKDIVLRSHLFGRLVVKLVVGVDRNEYLTLVDHESWW
jgi:hypothetical protein